MPGHVTPLCKKFRISFMKGFEYTYCANTRCSLKAVCARDCDRKVGDEVVVKFFHPVRGVAGEVCCSEFVKVKKL